MSTHYRAARIIGRGRFLAPVVFARFEQGVGLGERARAEEAGAGGIGRGMGRLEDAVAGGVDDRALLLCVFAPEDEDDAGLLLVATPGRPGYLSQP